MHTSQDAIRWVLENAHMLNPSPAVTRSTVTLGSSLVTCHSGFLARPQDAATTPLLLVGHQLCSHLQSARDLRQKPEARSQADPKGCSTRNTRDLAPSSTLTKSSVSDSTRPSLWFAFGSPRPAGQEDEGASTCRMPAASQPPGLSAAPQCRAPPLGGSIRPASGSARACPPAPGLSLRPACLQCTLAVRKRRQGRGTAPALRGRLSKRATQLDTSPRRRRVTAV